MGAPRHVQADTTLRVAPAGRDPDARHRHWLVRQSVRLWTAYLTWSSPHLEHYPTNFSRSNYQSL